MSAIQEPRQRQHGADPESHLEPTTVLSEEERHRVLDEFNATQRAYPENKLLHELFEDWASCAPDTVAVVFEGQSLTYGALNDRANRLANYLREARVVPDQLVGICVERSLEMVVGLLGILKAGGAYVPLDPSYPSDRLAYMLEDAAPGIVLTQEHLRDKLPRSTARVIALDRQWAEIARQGAENLVPATLGLRPDHLAYVIYTSGSTGRPKGAMNEHRAVVNGLTWMQSEYRLDGRDRVLQKTPFSFDVSVCEFFWTLSSGACLIMARPEGHRDPGYLTELIESTGITRVHFVPSMLQAFLMQHQRGRCATVRHIMCSGEELSAALKNKCLELMPQARLSDLYGPTECAVHVTAWECTADPEARRVPIGRPIANTQIYILDSGLQPVPVGMEGEIYIAGVGVGRGYWRRPELTAEKFVADPFSSGPQARMYKTGDLGRWRADGAIEYLGRNDHQVKVRGFRIELGEIEAQLACHSKIREVAVVAREDEPGEKRLVAYLVPHDPADFPTVEDLRTELLRALPDYMVPSAFVPLESMPVSPNGKLERKALPAPDSGVYTRRPYQAPVGEIERILAEIWQSLLRVTRIGRDENFFELGGHSLLALALSERIKAELAVELPLSAILEAPTIQRLAVRIAGKAPRESMVLIRAGEGGPPIFLVHDAFGETLLYRNLALKLDRRHAIYGLHPYTLPGVPMAHTRISDMAGYYIEKIRSVQPHGPYLLGGLCAGGVIAFEMALQLQCEREDVALVALLDAADIQAALKPYLVVRQRFDRIMGELQGEQAVSGVRRAGRIVGTFAAKLWTFPVYHIGKTWRRMRDSVRLRLLRASLDRGRMPPKLIGAVPVITTYLNAADEYRPTRVFDGELMLIRGTHGTGIDVPYVELYADNAFGWGRRCSQGVRVVDVPGGHNSMLQEPHVSVLAKRMQEAIDERLGQRKTVPLSAALGATD